MALRRKGCFYLMSVLLVVAPCAALTHNVTAAVGDSLPLKPDYSGEFSAITWLFNRDWLVVLELQPPGYRRFYQLEDRATIDDRTGALTITRLTKSESGNYTAEVQLKNGTIRFTDIKLNVLDRVSKPYIQYQITEKKIIVMCESATANVGYTWLDSQNNNVSTEQTYSVPRSRESVHLTCIVHNEVSSDSASIIIPPLSDFSVIGVVVAVLPILLILVIEIIRYCCKNVSCVRKINKIIPPFPYCMKGTVRNKPDEENGGKRKEHPPSDQQKGTAGNEHDEENGDKETELLLAKQQKDPAPFSFTLTIPHEGDTDGLNIKKDGAPLCEMGKIQGTPLLTIALSGQELELCKSDDCAEITAELLSDGHTDLCSIKDPAHSVDIKSVKEVTVKTEDEVLAKLFLAGSEPFADDVVLSPESLGINNPNPGYDGTYEVCFPDNSSIEFHIEVKKEGNKNMLKVVRRIVHQSQKRGAPDTIGSITLQPSRIADSYVWKRGEDKLLGASQKSEGDIFGDGKMKVDWETGNLTLCEVTAQDSGTYTLSSGLGGRDQEFTLEIEGQ